MNFYNFQMSLRSCSKIRLSEKLHPIQLVEDGPSYKSLANQLSLDIICVKKDAESKSSLEFPTAMTITWLYLFVTVLS